MAKLFIVFLVIALLQGTADAAGKHRFGMDYNCSTYSTEMVTRLANLLPKKYKKVFRVTNCSYISYSKDAKARYVLKFQLMLANAGIKKKTMYIKTRSKP